MSVNKIEQGNATPNISFQPLTSKIQKISTDYLVGNTSNKVFGLAQKTYSLGIATFCCLAENLKTIGTTIYNMAISPLNLIYDHKNQDKKTEPLKTEMPSTQRNDKPTGSIQEGRLAWTGTKAANIFASIKNHPFRAAALVGSIALGAGVYAWFNNGTPLVSPNMSIPTASGALEKQNQDDSVSLSYNPSTQTPVKSSTESLSDLLGKKQGPIGNSECSGLSSLVSNTYELENQLWAQLANWGNKIQKGSQHIQQLYQEMRAPFNLTTKMSDLFSRGEKASQEFLTWNGKLFAGGFPANISLTRISPETVASLKSGAKRTIDTIESTMNLIREKLEKTTPAIQTQQSGIETSNKEIYAISNRVINTIYNSPLMKFAGEITRSCAPLVTILGLMTAMLKNLAPIRK